MFMKVVKGLVVGVIVSFALLAILSVLGTQTPIEVYSQNKFQNAMTIFLLFEITAIAVEVATDSKSKEVGMDTVIVLIITICTYLYYSKFHGILLFSGNIVFLELLKKMAVPSIITIIFSAFGSTFIEDKLLQ